MTGLTGLSLTLSGEFSLPAPVVAGKGEKGDILEKGEKGKKGTFWFFVTVFRESVWLCRFQ